MHADAIKIVQARTPRPEAAFSSSGGLARGSGQALPRSVRAGHAATPPLSAGSRGRTRGFPWLAFATQRRKAGKGFKKGSGAGTEACVRRFHRAHTRMTLQLVSSLPARCSRLAVPRLRRSRILILLLLLSSSSCAPKSDLFSSPLFVSAAPASSVREQACRRPSRRCRRTRPWRRSCPTRPSPGSGGSTPACRSSFPSHVSSTAEQNTVVHSCHDPAQAF